MQGILSEVQEQATERLRPSPRLPDQRTLAKKVSVIEWVDKAALRSGSRLKRVVRARNTLCQLAARNIG